MVLKGRFICLFSWFIFVSPYVTFLAYNATNGLVSC